MQNLKYNTRSIKDSFILQQQRRSAHHQIDGANWEPINHLNLFQFRTINSLHIFNHRVQKQTVFCVSYQQRKITTTATSTTVKKK